MFKFMGDKQPRAVIYNRVSTDEQAREGTGLDIQHESNTHCCVANGFEIVAEFYEDYTGTLDRRPEMDKVMEMARTKRFDVLVVRDATRYARGNLVAKILDQQFYEYGARIFFASRGERTISSKESPFGAFLTNVEDAYSELEISNIKKRMLDGRNKLAADGVLNANSVPMYGFRRIGTKRDSYLEAVPERQEIRKLIFDWYTNYGYGTTRVADKLNEMHAETPLQARNQKLVKRKPSNTWTPPMVVSILRQESAIGVFYTNKFIGVKMPNGKIWTQLRPREEWVRVFYPELAITDEATFNRAQRMLNEQRTRHVGTRRNNYLMSRRAFCGTCGGKLNGSNQGKKGDILYYVCSNAMRKAGREKTCTCTKRLMAKHVDRIVWDWIRSLADDPRGAMIQLQEAQTAQRNENRDLHERMGHIKAVMAQQLDDLKYFEREKKACDKMNNQRQVAYYQSEIEHLWKEIEKAENELNATQAILNDRVLSNKEINDVAQMLEELRNELSDDADFEFRRQVVEALHVYVRLHPKEKRLVVEWYVYELSLPVGGASESVDVPIEKSYQG